jgi:hypothetical protein
MSFLNLFYVSILYYYYYSWGEIVLVDMPICSINNTFYISFIWFCNILNKADTF